MSIGKISEFRVGTDNWQLYVERLEQYFIVNNIAEELHVPTLVTVMGTECYELLVDLCTPSKPTTKTFAQLTEILKNHLQPKPSVLAERYKFRQRKQNNGESLAEYAASLKKLSKTCEFGAWLQESLRDQFVCGITSEIIRQRLFAEEKLEFAKAFTIAASMEAAEKDAAVVEGSSGRDRKVTLDCQAMSSGRRRDNEVLCGNAAYHTTRKERTGTLALRAAAVQPAGATARHDRARRVEGNCQACGGAHETARCRFTRYVCRVCNKQGHLRRMCPNIREHNAIDAIETEIQDATSDGTLSDELPAGRAAWQEGAARSVGAGVGAAGGAARRCSVLGDHPGARKDQRGKWTRSNRVRDASYGSSSESEGEADGVPGEPWGVARLLYAGLATLAVGLVVYFVGTGDKGFKTPALRLVGPTLIVAGLACCLLRIAFCIFAKPCCRRRTNHKERRRLSRCGEGEELPLAAYTSSGAGAGRAGPAQCSPARRLDASSCDVSSLSSGEEDERLRRYRTAAPAPVLVPAPAPSPPLAPCPVPPRRPPPRNVSFAGPDGELVLSPAQLRS